MEDNSEKRLGFIGMRVFKTVISVYLSFLYGMLRGTSSYYAVIAAIISMQTDVESGVKLGINRVLGTILGGVFGLFAILVIRFFDIEIYSHLHYLILTILLIPIIYTNVHLFSPKSTTISLVVFLSIAISHVQDISPLAFTFYRVLDTSVGVVISVFVNKFL